MFEDPYIISIRAKQRQKELLAELEQIRKIKSSSKMIFKRKKRRFGIIMLPIADLLIAVGVAIKRRWGCAPEETENTGSDGS